MKLIDKDALKAEITRLKTPYDCGWNCALDKVLEHIDDLEVKEVNLEKEIDEWMKYGPHTNYPWCTIPDAIKITAEHFFELALNYIKSNKNE